MGMPVEVFDSSGAAISWVDFTPVRLLDSAAVKSGTGALGGIIVGAAGTTISITVYDNTAASGTVIFGPYVLVAGASLQFGGAAFGTGLYVAFSATTGTPNITVLYR
jgi:hypothetical protein